MPILALILVAVVAFVLIAKKKNSSARDITQFTYYSDFMDYRKTRLQKEAFGEQLWQQKYAGRTVSWRARVYSIESVRDGILVKLSVTVDYYGEDSEHRINPSFMAPPSERDYYLSFSFLDSVTVTGRLPLKLPSTHDFTFDGASMRPDK